MSANDPLAEIEPKGLRVEFAGWRGEPLLVVPIVFRPGTTTELVLRIIPGEGVTVASEVKVGDAFQETFSRSHSTSGGVSFFGSLSHSRTFGQTAKPFSVVNLPDLKGVLLRLEHFEVREEPVCVQFAFPLSGAYMAGDEDFVAEVTLELHGKPIQKQQVPTAVHPSAGKILVISGYNADRHIKVFGTCPSDQVKIGGAKFPFLQLSSVQYLDLDAIQKWVSRDRVDGLHLYTDVHHDRLLIFDELISADLFFKAISGFELKFLFLDTCNSVQLISMFRQTDIGALVAATENLYTDYANEFQRHFYEALGSPRSISRSYHHATSRVLANFSQRDVRPMLSDPPPNTFTRSGCYDPMFLDLRSDHCFGRVGKGPTVLGVELERYSDWG